MVQEDFWTWLVKESRKPVNNVYISWDGGYVTLFQWLQFMKELWERSIERRYLRTLGEVERERRRPH